ncbi:MAG: phytanoyl-CoA dioxygenase family protein [Pseudomonadota bacterium]|nr:phytanoyl-CoA dioxygenase family protein [Pseudomonadota bacterium]|tara:strand:- start:2907 stop:3602 length:696 start_codon:yes stop_codon:yes gene_type:complete
MTSFNKSYSIDRNTFDQGYSVIRSLASNKLVSEIIAEIDRIIETSDSKWLNFNSAKTGKDEYIVIRSIDTPSDMLFRLGRDSLLVELAEEIGGKKVTPMYSEYFAKPPRSNCETPVHQDQAFYEEHFNDELGITFWIALDDCDENNGGMHVKPTESRTLLPHVKSDMLGFKYQMKNQIKDGFVAIKLEKGDALVHCAYTPHFCEPNTTIRARRAIAITFRTSQYREELFGV